MNAGEMIAVRAGSCTDNGKGSTVHQMPAYPLPPPRWIDEVLKKFAVVDLHHPEGRAQLAAALFAAVGGRDTDKAAQVIAETIRESARAVLTQRIAATPNGKQFIVDAEYSNHVARELGNNAAQAVLFILELGE